jgi:probable F420-dependent oxidoreductase
MAPPKLVMILSENWTLVDPRDLPAVVALAVEAEEAGFDAVMVSEHVVLGPGAGEAGLPANPRDYALPGNQDPRMPWPSSLLLLAAVASATSRIRLIAGAVIPPLRHPLLLAKELATLDLLSEGRLVVQPTVSWHRDEYRALGVPFDERGALLDEHLTAWHLAWTASPASFDGRHYRFADVFVEPAPYRAGGPPLWFGGTDLHARLIERLVRWGSGFNPLGRPAPDAIARLREALTAAGRDLSELELVGGTRGTFATSTDVADLDAALASIPAQVAEGYGTICIKPSQFTDDPGSVASLCRDIVERVAALTA